MTRIRLTRRRLLRGTAGVTVTGVAGCIGESGGTSSAGTTHTETEGEHGGEGNPPGHGESEHGHDTVSEPKQAREVLVNTARGDTTEYHFKPHVTWVTVGGTVTWSLQSGTHTATAYHPANDEPRLVPEGTAAWDSGTLSESGETYSHTFDTEGVYHYFCKPHERFGMLGTVVVGKPHLEEQTALGTMPTDKPKAVRGKIKRLNEMVRSILGGHHEDGGHNETDGHHGNETTDHGHHEEGTTEEGHHEAETTTDSH